MIYLLSVSCFFSSLASGPWAGLINLLSFIFSGGSIIVAWLIYRKQKSESLLNMVTRRYHRQMKKYIAKLNFAFHAGVHRPNLHYLIATTVRIQAKSFHILSHIDGLDDISKSHLAIALSTITERLNKSLSRNVKAIKRKLVRVNTYAAKVDEKYIVQKYLTWKWIYKRMQSWK